MSFDPDDLEPHQFESEPATLHNKQQCAIYVRNAYKKYGIRKDSCVVLNGLDMTVPRGAIYGLLGASGCGKTTLLNCVVGRRSLDSGEVWVLGGSPRTKASGVPGPRLGYMPQELALYGEFSMRETLTFYGWVTGMKKEKIDERVDFLQKILMIPDVNQIVKELSVGQQRRVSLATALLHEPELLILDEPTVGVDPVLRQIIWDHFIDLTKNGNTTIVITTHYIDETREANLIGLMRGGYLLAEESPQTLLTQLGLETLEEVFLKLSIMQNSRRHKDIDADLESSIAASTSVALENVESSSSFNVSSFGDAIELKTRTEWKHSKTSGILPEIPQQQEESEKVHENRLVLRKNNIKAIIWKNYLWIIRNVSIMLGLLSLPVLQMVVFCVGIGHDPYDVPVAVVNYEAQNNTNCSLTCNSTFISCHYLEYLEKRGMKLVYYDEEEDARQSVVRGKTYAYLVIKRNFTVALQKRIKKPLRRDPWNANSSTIEITRDDTVITISIYLTLYIYEGFLHFVQDYLQSCGYAKRVISLPVKMETPVYGENIPNFADFVTPGMILAVTFTLGIGLTAGTLLIERQEGSLNRYLVNGINELELFVAHFICQFGVLIAQLALTLIFTFAVFNMTVKGSLTIVTVLVILSGFCGMCFGFLIGSVFEEERTIEVVALGCLIPILALCGVVWPVEGMHPILKPFVPYFPLTKTVDSLRSLLQRGWDMSRASVYMGFVSIGIWTLIFLLLSILYIRFKKVLAL